jgi:hypothetical protein
MSSVRDGIEFKTFGQDSKKVRGLIEGYHVMPGFLLL